MADQFVPYTPSMLSPPAAPAAAAMPSPDLQKLNELKMLIQMGVLGEQGGELQDQMQLAQALRQGRPREYKTGLGAALGAGGDIFRQAASYRDEKTAKSDIAANRSARNDAVTKAIESALSKMQMGSPGAMPNFKLTEPGF